MFEYEPKVTVALINKQEHKVHGGKKSKGKEREKHTHEPSSKTVTCPHPVLFKTKATMRATAI